MEPEAQLRDQEANPWLALAQEVAEEAIACLKRATVDEGEIAGIPVE